MFFFCKFPHIAPRKVLTHASRDYHTCFVLHQHMVQQVHAVSRAQNLLFIAFQLMVSADRISSRVSFDRFGNTYNVTEIINDDASLNVEKYRAYSPLFLSTTFAMSYGLSFASITATLTHTFLYFRKQIWVQSRRSMSEQPDIHARLMSHYPQVPEWWYGIIFRGLSLLFYSLSLTSDIFHQFQCLSSGSSLLKSGIHNSQYGHSSLLL